MTGLRCVQCGRVIRRDVEPIYYRPSDKKGEPTEPVGLHQRCEPEYNGTENDP